MPVIHEADPGSAPDAWPRRLRPKGSAGAVVMMSNATFCSAKIKGSALRMTPLGEFICGDPSLSSRITRHRKQDLSVSQTPL